MALPKGNRVTLTGIVIPVDWDDCQQVIGAALATADEKEHRICMTKKGKELLGALQREIEATGILDRDEKGSDLLTVKRYRFK